MQESAQKLFTKMYEQQAQAAGAQGAGPDMGAGAGPDMGANTTYNAADDDVVDADFKEV